MMLIAVFPFCGIIKSYTQILQTNTGGDFISYIKLPPGISKSDVLTGNQNTRAYLHNYTKARLASYFHNDSFSGNTDRIIVFTDQEGVPVLPNRSGNQQVARVSNYELSYTFDSPSQPWTSSQLSSFNTWANDIYPVIKQVIGNPFFNITVNVSKDSTIAASGYFYLSYNEMVLRSAASQVFCHESIHAFRDDYIMALSTYEEGLTRAAEIEVFNELVNYTHPSDEFHSYEYDQYYAALNRPAIGCVNGNATANITLTALKYNISSYTWGKAYLEDNSFLKKFNDSLYERAAVNISTLGTESTLRNIFENIKPVIEGLPASMWYDKQFILNTHPSTGYQLYQRINQYVIDYFYRDSYGNETPQSGATLSWQIFNNADVLITSGSGVSSAGYGWVDCHTSITGYTGRVKVIASVQSPQGLLTDTVFRANQPGASGVFGVVEDANTGTISVTPLDTAMATQTTVLVNGAFFISSFKNVRGRFRIEYNYPDCGHVSKIFTKDRSNYFISIKKEPFTYWVGSLDNSWHNQLNWSGGTVPDECMDVIMNPNTKFNCVINAPASCRSLTLNNGVILTANSNLFIKPQ
jgi:hypothetical protein